MFSYNSRFVNTLDQSLPYKPDYFAACYTMALRTILNILLLAPLTVTSPVAAHEHEKPAAFFLAGDSTTAIQSTGGGGWGNGFLATLLSPAYGVNKGHNGATTASFVKGGDWATVLELVKNATETYNVFVTIQFGHNDQVRASVTPPAADQS
jgi:lysophospholipase L1-like esterase